MGTNDMLHDADLFLHSDQMKQGFIQLANAIQNINPKPEIYLMIPPPISWKRLPKKRYNYGAHLSTTWLADLISNVADTIKLP